MNDIEKQIEGEEKESKEESHIKLNRNNKKNKTIVYILGGVIILLLIATIIYLVIINRENKNKNSEPSSSDTIKNDVDVEENYIYYVSCDDNTALLNVRNSTSGDIIDGLSCYKQVNIEEELEKTEACDKWYKINYKKRESNYTGYACGTYIKKSNVTENEINKVKELIDKANDYYENSVIKPYCGKTSTSKDVSFKSDDGTSDVTGEYVKSEYKNIEEIKTYLSTFLDPSLFKNELKLSDINNPKQYDNYYEIDGELYCRNYTGKGWLSNYTGNYDIEIVSNTDNKIVVNIAYEYLTDDSKCDIKDLSKCSNSNFKYEISKINIEDGIIKKMDFHK